MLTETLVHYKLICLVVGPQEGSALQSAAFNKRTAQNGTVLAQGHKAKAGGSKVQAPIAETAKLVALGHSRRTGKN